MSSKQAITIADDFKDPGVIENGILDSNFKKLIKDYEEIIKNKKQQGGAATIHVDEIASKVAFIYERIRKIIDWKEEHLIRRGAIERVLKRRLISELSSLKLANFNPEKSAEPMILELIRGGHFANDQIPREKIEEVKKVLKKYLYILSNNPLHNSANIKDKINLYNWLLEIAACEIEEVLDPPMEENLFINFMTQSILKKLKLTGKNRLSNETLGLQTYIAVHRALFRLDAPIISYHLIKYYSPTWREISQSQLATITENIQALVKKIEADLHHPYASKFQKICERYDTVYLIIKDIFEKIISRKESLEEKTADIKTLNQLIRECYQDRLSTLKSRLYRAAIYSTLSIFVAGGLSLFIFEIPLAKLFYGQFSPLAILVDILIPTIVMFILVAIIRLPKADNLKKIISEVQKIVYQTETEDVYEIRISERKNWLMNLLIGVIYALTNVISVLLVFWIFKIAKVPVTSLYIDTLNVAMVVFAALIIRQKAKEMTVTEKVSFGEFLLDILSIPVGKLGQWLSAKWKEWNIVSVFFTAIVDIPFLTITEFIENWSSFIKEKKAEIR